MNDSCLILVDKDKYNNLRNERAGAKRIGQELVD